MGSKLQDLYWIILFEVFESNAVLNYLLLKQQDGFIQSCILFGPKKKSQKVGKIVLEKSGSMCFLVVISKCFVCVAAAAEIPHTQDT